MAKGDLHADDGIDEEKHCNEQNYVWQRLQRVTYITNIIYIILALHCLFN